MYYIDKTMLRGPYYPGEEERFKQDALRAWRNLRDGWSYFCIESPGTADGFPDVLAVSDRGRYQLFEFKVSDSEGCVRFQKTQPLFYKKNAGLTMFILAWDVTRQRAVYVTPDAVVAEKSLRFKLPESRGFQARRSKK